MEKMELRQLKNKKIHFIGIGGISMSALAQMLVKYGCTVQGSDLAENNETKILQKRNIKVFLGHDAENVAGVDAVCYTSAVHEDNPELVQARKLGIKILKRAELLGMIAENYKTVIAVAGSHGKTTTTAMIAEVFMQANLKPTLQLGGTLKKIHSNYKLGNKKFFIVEACEYKDNFLLIKPDIAVVLNVDSDHLDYFLTLDGVKLSFKKFAKNLKDGGICIACSDDENSKEILSLEDVSTFGKLKKSDVYAKNIREYKPGYFGFDAYFCGYKLGKIELNIFGEHNIYNALACILVCIACEIDFCDIKFALENFSGVERRSEKMGEINGAEVYHDYAHHPAQIEKMISLAKSLANNRGGRLFVVFEPHTYSRTKFLLEDFAKSFQGADHIIFAPAYSAREKLSEGFEADTLAMATKKYVDEIEYILNYDEIYSRIKKLAKPKDIVFILGAGTIEKLAKMFTKS